MTTTTAPAPLLLTIGVLAFVQAYTRTPTDNTGTRSIRTLANLAGCTYLAAAERASDLSYAGRAALSGPMTDARVRLH